LAESDLTVRKVESLGADAHKFDRELLALLSDGREAILPSPEDVEAFYDDLAGLNSSQRDMNSVAAFRLIHSAAAAEGSGAREPQKLLSRTDLARLWGVEGWAIDQTFDRVLPCHKSCSLGTGFAVSAGGGDLSTVCGVSRWCYPCDAWYAVLHAAPPPHVFTVLQKVLHKIFSQSTGGPNNLFTKMPHHVCDGSDCLTY